MFSMNEKRCTLLELLTLDDTSGNYLETLYIKDDFIITILMDEIMGNRIFKFLVSEEYMENLYNELKSYGFDFENYRDFKNKLEEDCTIHYSLNEFVEYEEQRPDSDIEGFIFYFSGEELSKESLKYIKDIKSFMLAYSIQHQAVIIPKSIKGVILDWWTFIDYVSYLENYKPNYEGINQFL